MSPKTLTGRVVSDKMDKTVVVVVESRRRHPRYKRVVKYSKRFKAHDQDNVCHLGDLVRIIETRPLSKEIRWRVAEILSQREAVQVPPTEVE